MPQPDAASVPPADAQGNWPRPAYAWYAIIVLLVAYAFAIVDRIAIGLLVAPIKADLGISDTQIGLLQGFSFAIFYALFGLPMGVLVDRWRRVRLLSLGVFTWSMATIACGLSRSYPMLFLSRVGVGAGEATVTPASSSIIADLFRPEARAKAYGVFMVGGTIGTALAYVLGGGAIATAKYLRAAAPWLLGDMRDWQIAFLLMGSPGVVLAILIAATIREPLRHDRRTTGTVTLGTAMRFIADNRLAYLAIIGGAVLNVMIINAQLAWWPTLFMRVHGWTAAEIATVLGLVALPLGTFSAVSSGFVMSWLARRGRRDGPLLVILLQSIVWASFGPLKCLVGDTTLAIAAHAMTSLFANWSVTAALVGVNQITPNEMRGQVTAIYVFFVGLVGVTVGPLAVGLLTDNVFTAATGVAPSLAAVFAGGGVLSFLVLGIGWREFGRSVERAEAWTSR